MQKELFVFSKEEDANSLARGKKMERKLAGLPGELWDSLMHGGFVSKIC